MLSPSLSAAMASGMVHLFWVLFVVGWVSVPNAHGMQTISPQSPPQMAPQPAPSILPSAPGGPPDGAMTDIHGLKPLLPMGADWQRWIWIITLAAAILALAAIGWWLWRRRKTKRREPVAPPLAAPDAQAYARLDALAADDPKDMKLFYFQLSAIIRAYVERRFAIPAAEMTTEELLPHMRRLLVDPELNSQFREFCHRSDPIKFAGAAASAPSMDGGVARELAFGRDFVRRTTRDAAAATQDATVQVVTEEARQIGYQAPEGRSQHSA